MEAAPIARAPILAVVGLSGAGKSRLLGAIARSGRATALPEPWTTLRPRPGLGVHRPGPLLSLEHRLLREEGRRWQRAERIARTGRAVWLDTAPVSPITYARGLCALLGLPWDPRLWLGRPETATEVPEFVRLPDLVIYRSAPPLLTLRRTLDRPRSSDTGHEAQHLLVGLVEEEFWLGEFRRRFPDRLAVAPGRESTATLLRRTTSWSERAARLGPARTPERGRLATLLARPARLPERLGRLAANR